MAHFARLQNNTVIDVVVIHNEDIIDENGVESEQIGILLCRSIWGYEFDYLQTSYNKNIRKNYAGAGYTYDAVRDAFIPPSPGENCTLNEQTCNWECIF